VTAKTQISSSSFSQKADPSSSGTRPGRSGNPCSSRLSGTAATSGNQGRARHCVGDSSTDAAETHNAHPRVMHPDTPARIPEDLLPRGRSSAGVKNPLRISHTPIRVLHRLLVSALSRPDKPCGKDPMRTPLTPLPTPQSAAPARPGVQRRRTPAPGTVSVVPGVIPGCQRVTLGSDK